MEEAIAAMALLDLSSPSPSKSHCLIGSDEVKSHKDEIQSLTNSKTHSVAPSKKGKKKNFPSPKASPKKQAPKFDLNGNASANQDFSSVIFLAKEKENSLSEKHPSDRADPLTRATRASKFEAIFGSSIGKDEKFQISPKNEILRMEKSLEETLHKQMDLFLQLEQAYREQKEGGVEKPVRLLSEDQYRCLEVTVKSLNKEVPELIRNFKAAWRGNERGHFQ